MLFRSTCFLKKKESLQKKFLELLKLCVKKHFEQHFKILNATTHVRVLYLEITHKL